MIKQVKSEDQGQKLLTLTALVDVFVTVYPHESMTTIIGARELSHAPSSSTTIIKIWQKTWWCYSCVQDPQEEELVNFDRN